LKKLILSSKAVFKSQFQQLLRGLPIKNAVLVEVIIAFLTFDVVNWFYFAYDMGFIGATIHPYWLVILLLACRYGFGAGLVSGMAAAVHYALFFFGGLPTRPEIEKAAETNELLMPIAFIAVSIMIGSIRQRFLESELEKDKLLADQQKSLERAREWLEHSEKAREVLENRIVGQTTTVKTLYEISRKLESWDAVEIYQGCLEILAQHFAVEQATFYTRENDNFVVKTAWGQEHKNQSLEKNSTIKDLLNLTFTENKIVTVKDIFRKDAARHDRSEPILAMFPVHGDMGNPIGIVAIERMDFYHFNHQNLKTIGLVIDWSGQALQRVKFFNSLKEKAIYDEEYDMYTYAHFQDVLKNEFLRARTFDLDLAVSLIRLDNFNFLDKESQKLLLRAVSSLLKRFMNKTDMIFRYRMDGTFMVISPMRKKEDIAEAFIKISEGLNEVCRTAILATLYKPNVTIHTTELHQDIKDPVELVGHTMV